MSTQTKKRKRSVKSKKPEKGGIWKTVVLPLVPTCALLLFAIISCVACNHEMPAITPKADQELALIRLVGTSWLQDEEPKRTEEELWTWKRLECGIPDPQDGSLSIRLFSTAQPQTDWSALETGSIACGEACLQMRLDQSSEIIAVRYSQSKDEASEVLNLTLGSGEHVYFLRNKK